MHMTVLHPYSDSTVAPPFLKTLKWNKVMDTTTIISEHNVITITDEVTAIIIVLLSALAIAKYNNVK